MLAFLTILIMAVVAYASVREGIFTAFVMAVNVFVAGLVAFNFFEPLANALDPLLADSFLAGYEDAFCLLALFCLTLGGLRWATNNLARTELDFPAMVLRGGSVLFGMITGYLVSGFLVCVLQTLPWHEHFLHFNAKYDPASPTAGFRRVLPPDRVWLALMHRAGTTGLGRGDQTFDRNGNFELRYERYRRYGDNRDALPDDGACPP